MRRPLCLVALVFAAAVFLIEKIYVPAELFPSEYDRYVVSITGVVVELQEKRDSEGNIFLQATLQDLHLESGVPDGANQSLEPSIKALCAIEEANAALLPGQTVLLRGKIRTFSPATNDGGFDSRLYYSISKIAFRITDAHILKATDSQSRFLSNLYLVRKTCGDILDACFSSSQADILRAMLLGETGRLQPEDKRLFQENAVIHIICISGTHISALSMILYTILRKIRCPGLLTALAVSVLIFLYGLMTGMHASAVRAMVMFLLHVLAPLIGRTYDLFSAIAIASILLLIEQPLYLLHSGFQFSFCAVLALGLLAPSLPKFLRLFAIPIATLPIQLCSYYTFSPYSLILNLLIIPLAGVVISSGFVTLLIGNVFLVLRVWSLGESGGGNGVCGGMMRILAFPATAILQLYKWLCEIAGRLPCHQLVLGKPAAWVVATYLGILALICLVKELWDVQSGLQKRKRRRLAVAQTLLLAAGIVLLFWARPKVLLEVDFMDVGQGDCEVIRAGGTNVMIDGGSSSKTEIGEYILKPFLYYHGISNIDVAIVTHEDMDHCSGLVELLEASAEKYSEDAATGQGRSLPQVRAVVLPHIAEEAKGDTYKRIEELCRKDKIKLHYMERGEKFVIGSVELKCLHPEEGANYEEANAESLVFLLSYKEFSCLFTGDLEGDGEKEFLSYIDANGLDEEWAQRLEKLTVLKVAHHGSRFATSAEFLKKVNADYAVISCGVNNRYGHLSEETVERLREEQMRIYDTRVGGQISVQTDGERVRILEKNK